MCNLEAALSAVGDASKAKFQEFIESTRLEVERIQLERNEIQCLYDKAQADISATQQLNASVSLPVEISLIK